MADDRLLPEDIEMDPQGTDMEASTEEEEDSTVEEGDIAIEAPLVEVDTAVEGEEVSIEVDMEEGEASTVHLEVVEVEADIDPDHLYLSEDPTLEVHHDVEVQVMVQGDPDLTLGPSRVRGRFQGEDRTLEVSAEVEREARARDPPQGRGESRFREVLVEVFRGVEVERGARVRRRGGRVRLEERGGVIRGHPVLEVRKSRRRCDSQRMISPERIDEEANDKWESR